MTTRKPDNGVAKPLVAVFGLGGTIASVPDASGAASPGRDIGTLIKEQALVPSGVEVRGRQLLQVASSELTVSDIVVLSHYVRDAMRSGASGVIVAQGTDTIEETAFGLDVLLGGEQTPVVITGAMRHPRVPGSDAGANLTAAFDVVMSGAAHGQGVLVVMNDEIHAARFVAKSHTSSPSAFRSSPAGAVGWITERRAQLPLAVRDFFPPLEVSVGTRIPRVALVSIGLGDDGQILKLISESDYQGCVVETMGGGHVPATVAAIIGPIAARMPVVVTSRTGSGSLLQQTYSFPGSETDLRDRGVISSGYLPTSKARLLLALLLATNAQLPEIRAAFKRF
ncbi:MAG: asparaginase [Microbacteriaceae bacterium]